VRHHKFVVGFVLRKDERLHLSLEVKSSSTVLRFDFISFKGNPDNFTFDYMFNMEIDSHIAENIPLRGRHFCYKVGMIKERSG
jgi:hypothetical protein